MRKGDFFMPQIYNYLLQSYPLMRQVKYPAQKSSDLKRIYSNIVNISRRSPFFKVNISKENQEYAIGIKESSIALKSKLADIADEENPCYSSKDISVSNKNIISAKLTNNNTDKLPQTVSMKIHSLASGQVNKGNEIYENSHGMATGNYEFDVKIPNHTYSLAYKQKEKTENIETMYHIIEYLNQSVPGIKAFVESGTHKGYSNIVIESMITGKQAERNLILEDTDDIHTGIVDYFDLNHMEQPAKNAQFEINGITKETISNSFTLENTLNITLLDTSEEPVNINIIPDSNQILNQVKSVVSTYNNLLKLAKDFSESSTKQYRPMKLINEIKSIGSKYQDELEACGFEIDEYGLISMDDMLAHQAAVDGGMESLFTRKNGFIEKLQEKMDMIMINPMDYLDKLIITYPGNERTSYANPYITSMYSGLLFNSYC